MGGMFAVNLLPLILGNAECGMNVKINVNLGW
jgi:hypothetical protein